MKKLKIPKAWKLMFHKHVNMLDGNALEVLQKSSSSALVKTTGMFVGLVVNIFLGRVLGPDGLGIINLSNQIGAIFLILTSLGMSQLIIKEVARAYGRSDWHYIGDVMFSSYRIIGIVAFVVSITLIFLSHFISNNVFNEPELTFPLIIVCALLTPQVFSRIFSSAMVGYGKIWQSNLVDQTLSTVITGILLLLSWLNDLSITINSVAIFYGIGRIIVTLATSLYWKKLFTPSFTPKFIGSRLLKTALPLLLVSATLIVASSVDAIMLGWLRNSKEVGLYTVASRLTLLTSFFLQITITALAPKIATLYSQNEIMKLERMVKSVTRILMLIAVLSVIFFFLFGRLLLSLWGEEFREAYWILIILSIGQGFNIASGPVGNLLIMTDNEKILSNITVFFLILNVVLNYFFIIRSGFIGAATATTITIGLNMLVSSFYVKRKIGFIPWAITIRSLKNKS